MRLVEPPEDNTIKRLKGEIAWSLRHKGGGDMYRLSRMASAAPGDVLVDVGSNVGDFALSAVALFPGVRVLAFEPSPLTHFYLCWNLWLNDIRVLSPSEFGRARGGVLPLNKVAGAARHWPCRSCRSPSHGGVRSRGQMERTCFSSGDQL